jgi:branched-chain amino acid transport system substrate-binding protein
LLLGEIYNLPLSGAAPLISKAKGKDAEVLACLSMFDDGVMLTRAAKAMNYTPKMIYQLMVSTIPVWMKEMGPDGNYVTADGWWNGHLPFPGNDVIKDALKTEFNLPAVPTYFGLGYCWMKPLELAVQGAGTLDDTKIRDYLRTHKFDLPYLKGVTFDKTGMPPCLRLRGPDNERAGGTRLAEERGDDEACLSSAGMEQVTGAMASG